MPKFFVNREQISEGNILIGGDDARHISYSLRMAKGDVISVCDDLAREYECVLRAFEEDCVIAEIVNECDAPGEPPLRISLYQGLPKGDKLETVIQKAVECGVSEIIPFESSRCVAKVKGDAEARKTERRNKIAIEAAKQCGRGKLPVVKSTVDFKTAVSLASQESLSLICYEDEGHTTLKDILSKVDPTRDKSLSIIVGSEGGFSKEEIQYAKENGIYPISLGKRILRTETAPVFVLSCIAYEFEL